MRRHSSLVTALLATGLLAAPAESEAFFGFFGGGFSFGFGGGFGSRWWGGPGWWGYPGWYGYGYGPYAWHWYRPWGHPYLGYPHYVSPFYGLSLPYAYVPRPVLPAVQAPATVEEK